MIWCLHGAVGMAADWDEFAARIAEAGEEARAVDLWEFVEDGGCSFLEFGTALAGRVKKEDPAPVLLGYSLGGRLALHALLAAPELWKGAVVVSAHPGLAGEEERILRMVDDAHWAAQALRGSWGQFLVDWNAQGVLGDTPGEGLADRAELEPRRAAVARGFMEWSLGKQEDLRPRLREIGCPTLWLTGAGDGKFTGLASEAGREAERIRHEIVAGAGHRIPWERGEDFATRVRDFLGGL